MMPPAATEGARPAGSWNIWESLCLLGILSIGLLLRLNGADWGLPNVLHPQYSYHPDEVYLIAWAEMLKDGQIIAKHFQYGGTFFFVVLQALTEAAKILSGSSGGSLILNAVLLGRFFSMACALASILFTALAGSALFHRSVGLLAALLLAVFPGHVFCAQNARPDELFTLFIILNLYLASRILKGVGSPTLHCLLGGILLGVSVATRFPAASFLLMYVAALALSPHRQASRPLSLLREKGLWLLLAVSIPAYLLASPHTLMHFHSFLAGMRVQWMYQSGEFIEALGRGPGWYQYGGRILSQSMGYPFYGLALLAVGLASFRHSREDLLVLVGILAYFLLLAKASWVVVRYSVPLLPLLALLISRTVMEACTQRMSLRIPSAAAAAAAVCCTLLISLAFGNALRKDDPRDVASLWLLKSIPKESHIAAFSAYPGDMFWNPPASAMHRWSLWNMQEAGVPEFLGRRFDVIVLNDEIVREALRLRESHPQPAYRELYQWITSQEDYDRAAFFERSIEIAGLDLGFMFTAGDYTLVRPRITIYRKK